MPGGQNHHRYICRITCDTTVKPTYRNGSPILLALDRAAAIKNMRQEMERATGVPSTHYSILRSSSSSQFLDDNERVFSNDPEIFTWADQTPNYLLRYKPQAPPPGDGEIQIQVKAAARDLITINCKRGITVLGLKMIIQNRESIHICRQNLSLRGLFPLTSGHQKLTEDINNVRLYIHLIWNFLFASVKSLTQL